jgi:hypothetical protein
VRRHSKPDTIKFRGAVPIRDGAAKNPFIFRGRVSEAGYEWLDGRDGKPRLVPLYVPGAPPRSSDPHPGLFREFAGLKPTKDAIRGFANTYGDLLGNYEPRQSAHRKDGSVAFGATLETWKQEIGDMRVLVRLSDHIKNQDLAELKKILRRTAKELCYVIETPKRRANVTLAHADLSESGLDRFDADGVLAARCALQIEINNRIAEAPPVPRLAWTPDYHQRIIFEPPNLLAAMWAQFAQDITDQLRLVQCACGCGRYFQVGPGAFKKHKTTFDAACRKRKSRSPHKALPGRPKWTA